MEAQLARPNVEHTCYYARSDAVYHNLDINQTNIIGAHGIGGIETGRVVSDHHTEVMEWCSLRERTEV